MNRPIHRTRRKPRMLAHKLLKIREAMGLNQTEMGKLLGSRIRQNSISSWESGKREPDLLTLLKYAELANVCADALLRDELELPDKLPPKTFYAPHK
jgi:transcriptional regulator with XRE-family HTH domain